MRLVEAKAVVEKLHVNIGKIMQPFDRRVKEFIIVPKGQKEFDMMFRDIIENKKSFEQAIQPYKDFVTVIVYFDTTTSEKGASYCDYEYFIQVNNIKLDI